MGRKSNSLLKTGIAAFGILHCINKIIDSVSISNTASKTTGKYFHWKHGDIFYKVSGEGSPLLLIHDLTVFSSNYEWLQLIDELSKKHTVYSIDLIGCGKSEKPSIIYTNYFYVQLISDFVNNIIKESTDVVVSGLSSSFVIMANQMNNNLFRRIFMVNPESISHLKQAPDERSKFIQRLFEFPVIGKTLFYISINKINIEDYLTEKCFYNPFNVRPSTVKAYYDASHSSNGEGKSLLASIYGYYLNTDITNALKSAKNEIILINGEYRDHAESIESIYKNINPNIISYTINQTKLLPQIESPDELIQIIMHS